MMQTEQRYSIVNGPSITLQHITVEAVLDINDTFRKEIRRILKKDFPPSVQIQLLLAPNSVSCL